MRDSGNHAGIFEVRSVMLKLTTTTALAAIALFIATEAATAARSNLLGAGRTDMPHCYYTMEGGEYIPRGFCNAPYSKAGDGKPERPEPVVEVTPPKDPCRPRRSLSRAFQAKKALQAKQSKKVSKQTLSERSGKGARIGDRASRKAERQAARAANRASKRSLASNEGGRRGGKARGKADRGSMALEVQFLEPLM